MTPDNNYNYWDSCVFIDGLRQTPGRFPQIAQLDATAKSGDIYIFCSTLAIAEVVKMNSYGPLRTAEEQNIAAYFRHKFIKLIQVDRTIARSAAEIVRQHELKPPDAIHVATAIRTRGCVLYTYDKQLLDKSGQTGDPVVLFKNPGELASPTLFSESQH